jgi:hypothetical protein
MRRLPPAQTAALPALQFFFCWHLLASDRLNSKHFPKLTQFWEVL